MLKLHPEPLLFCFVWAALAVAAGIMASIWMGILFSAGMALVLMPLSATIITRTENLALERQVRWGLLAIAALGLMIWLQLAGASS